MIKYNFEDIDDYDFSAIVRSEKIPDGNYEIIEHKAYQERRWVEKKTDTSTYLKDNLWLKGVFVGTGGGG